jgi:RNA-directed DNA polymerase
MQLSLFSTSETTELKEGFSLEAIFEAYFFCRSNKRNTINALAFELDYESNLIQLWNELNDGSYQPGKSIAFIVHKPVQREIFAADFRDRVVHHLIINKLNPLRKENVG